MAEVRTTRIIRPLRGGQITIPAEFRTELGINSESVLEISLANGELRLRPLSVSSTVGGSPWLKELYDVFAPVREEAQELGSADVDTAIDAAVRAVRRKE